MNIVILGGKGFLGKNLEDRLKSTDHSYKILDSSWDLRNPTVIETIIRTFKPDVVVNCSGKIGGILENLKKPYEFLYDNMIINMNVINGCVKNKVKLINFGSSCAMPKDHPVQPMKEEFMGTGQIEESNYGYALAKIAGLKLAEYANKELDADVVSLSLTNLYGIHSHFDLKTSHALSAIILKVWNAYKNNENSIVVFGSGLARREWIFCSDVADCILWTIENNIKTEKFLNVGTGIDTSMNDLANMIIKSFQKFVDLPPINIVNDTTKPEGMVRKLLDVSKINDLGWSAKTSLEEGIDLTVKHFLEMNR